MAHQKAPQTPRRWARWTRWAVLSVVLAGMTLLGYLHQELAVDKPAGVDALCPFGGLETLFSLVTTGAMLKKVAVASVILLVATVAMALLARRSFCGRVCPLGFLQELMGGLGHRVLRGRRTMPAALDRPARLLKYAVLAGFIGLAWATADLAIRPYDPWVAWQHLTSADLITDFAPGLAVLGVALAGSFVYDRFFCKYLCPMGAFLGLFSKASLFRVTRTTANCIDCRACDKACPMNVTVSAVQKVDSPECISCGECVTACPVKDTLAFAGPGSRRVSPVVAAAGLAAGFALIVGATTLSGHFDWTAPSFAQSVAETAPAPDGSFDVGLIKGSSVLAEVMDAAGIPPETVEQVFGVPVAEQDRPIKDIKSVYGFSPEDVRTFVEIYRQDPEAAAAFVPAGE
ncbi:MAG: 4Fe-4S binding protein [Actinomycetia bacterium]|nr:4Fe-4S binding protein [Actinomycetes bacterium]